METVRTDAIQELPARTEVRNQATGLRPAPQRRAVGAVLWWLLPLACIHWLIYLALVPPWQHYDEPTHFEYAALIARWGAVPVSGAFDPALRNEIADSMYRFRFWQADVQPDLFSAQAPNIGLDQTVHPPLYYALIALPIRLVQYGAIEPQLYVARLVGLVLYLLTIAVAWRVSIIIAPDQPLLHLVIPLLVCLSPSFTDMMSAVNNDVLVNFSLSAMLLGCMLLIRDGLRPLPLLLAVLGLLVGLLAKRTAVIGVIPFGFALLWAIHQQATRWWAWIGGMLALIVLVSSSAFQYDVIVMADGPHQLLRVRPWLVALDEAYLRLNIDASIQSLTDWKRSHAFYPILIEVAFTSYWQRFGWGHVRMGALWERATMALALLASLGLAVQGLRARNRLALWQKRCIWLFLATLVAAVAALIVRLHPLPPPGVWWTFIPGGRYIHFTIIPVICLLVIGMQGLTTKSGRAYSLAVLLIYFALLDTAAWAFTIGPFYYQLWPTS